MNTHNIKIIENQNLKGKLKICKKKYFEKIIPQEYNLEK